MELPNGVWVVWENILLPQRRTVNIKPLTGLRYVNDFLKHKCSNLDFYKGGQFHFGFKSAYKKTNGLLWRLQIWANGYYWATFLKKYTLLIVAY